jgi:hypothetical protein
MLRYLPLALLFAALPAHADERTFMLSGFDRIRVEGPFDVTVTTGGSATARAEGDTRAVQDVEVRTLGSTLVVSRGVNGWGGYPGAARRAPKIVVSAPNLRGVSLTGSGRVSVSRMRGARVDLSLTGTGTVQVSEIDADQLVAVLVGTGAMSLAGRTLGANVQTNGAGTIDAQGLTANDLQLNAQSAGDATFTVRRTAKVSALGQGTVRVGGGATCTVNGAGPVVCDKDGE